MKKITSYFKKKKKTPSTKPALPKARVIKKTKKSSSRSSSGVKHPKTTKSRSKRSESGSRRRVIVDSSDDEDVVMRDKPRRSQISSEIKQSKPLKRLNLDSLKFDEDEFEDSGKGDKKKKDSSQSSERKRKRGEYEKDHEDDDLHLNDDNESDDDEDRKPKRFKMNDFRLDCETILPERDAKKQRKFEEVFHMEEVKKSEKNEEMRKGVKLSPLEKQIMELREKHPDLMLIIQVGYKFNIYGDDAKKAAEILGIGCFRGRNFMQASFPIARLMYHTKKLVSKGIKVGVCTQKETAAIKSKSNSKTKVFKRDLDKIYTNATFISDDGDELSSGDNYILVLFENKHHISIVASEVSTGKIFWDDFEEETGFMRRQLHGRLIEIKPVEIITKLEGKLSKETEQMLDSMKFIKRKERIKFNQDFSLELKNSEKLPKNVKMCLFELNQHLSNFGLNQVVDLTKAVHLQSLIKNMNLNGTTLWNLEIFQDIEGDKKRGLMEFIDYTKSKFGKRLLKRWITNPLKDHDEINKRLDSVEYLINLKDKGFSTLNDFLSNKMAKLPDFERLFFQVIYKRIKPKLLLEILKKLVKLLKIIKEIEQKEKIENEYITQIISQIPVQNFGKFLKKLLNKFSHDAAQRNDFSQLFTEDEVIDDYEEIKEHKESLEDYISKLELEHLEEIREITGIPNLKYKKVGNDNYLVELENSVVNEIDIPEDWERRSKTKKYTRYITDTTEETLIEINFHTEHLEKLSNEAYDNILTEFAKKYSEMREVVNNLSILDCLNGFAELAKSNESYVRPKIIKSEDRIIKVKDGRHPVVERFLALEGKKFIPNDVCLDSRNDKAIIMTGPNANGKSVFIKMIAVLSIMSQTGCFVPCSEMEITPLDSILTRMGAYDDISTGSSTFFIEASEASQILKKANKKSLVILDELGRGTSTFDGTAIACSTLEFLLEKECLTVFVTHYPEVTKLELKKGGVKNYHMSYFRDGEDVTLLYKSKEGRAEGSYGINVAKLAGVEENIIRFAMVKSKELFDNVKKKVNKANFGRMMNLDSNNIDELREFQKEIKFSLM